MTDIEQYVPLKQVVSYTLDETEQSMGSFDRAWILAFRALVDLLLDVTAEPVTVRLPVAANKTVALPADCLWWSKIGQLNDQGEVVTLKINNALTTYKDNNPNRLSGLTPDINNSFSALAANPYYLNYYYNGTYQPLFGVGGGVITYGDCKVDETNRVIILNINFDKDSIMLEYVSSPQKNGDYMIPITCQEAVIAFIKWKDKKGTRDEYMGEKIAARRRMPNKKVHLQDVNQVLRESEAQKLRS